MFETCQPLAQHDCVVCISNVQPAVRFPVGDRSFRAYFLALLFARLFGRFVEKFVGLGH